MIFDTHIHLNDDELYKDIDRYLSNANKKCVTHFLCIGTDHKSNIRAIELANKYENIYAAIGYFPTDVYNLSQNDLDELEALIINNKKVVAIGEIGLDYYWEKDENKKNLQKLFLIKQIEIANKYNLPICLHIRDAIKDAVDILKEHTCKLSGIAHCFSGSKESGLELIKLGYYLSFGGVITFKNAKVSKEVVISVPKEYLLVETDAPYLSPTPYRGQLNEPEFIVETVKEMSNLLNMTFDEVSTLTFNNAKKILRIK